MILVVFPTLRHTRPLFPLSHVANEDRARQRKRELFKFLSDSQKMSGKGTPAFALPIHSSPFGILNREKQSYGERPKRRSSANDSLSSRTISLSVYVFSYMRRV